MDRSIKDYFRIFGVSPKVFEGVALTPEQIRKYNITLRPNKHDDSRRKKFETKYNTTGAAELDAFFADNPKEFEKMIQDSVDDYYDKKIYDDLKEKYKKEPTADELRAIHDDMFYRIKAAFSGQWDREIRADLEDLYEDEDNDDDDDDE